ncbi:hypothetical protein F5882DRAFT_396419 [Hyaloscypha sp. PMI_1271]|nr:hypothetical protein F5882DRAFT_396419 [Hyaloscypha sp. PMI_1271]
MNSPFTEAEKRFILAEAIKSSNTPNDRLFSVLAEYNVSPDWEQMLLPHGKFCNLHFSPALWSMPNSYHGYLIVV